MTGRRLLLVCIFSVCYQARCTVARGSMDDDMGTTTAAPRIREMDETNLILLNVAAKGRVVELLANELARTEIIRALLVEYAQECVHNVTTLEKGCIDCMFERCRNRIAECGINIPPLREVITHDPSPIMGLEFLTQTSTYAENQLKEFADKARSDILKGVPKRLRKESAQIMHSETDRSLRDLADSMKTDKIVRDISVHVQKAANNVHLLPRLGDKVGTMIIDNEDRAVNIADFLAKKLKRARPLLESMGHNGERMMDAMPTVIAEVGQKVATFKNKVYDIFGKALNTFQEVVNNPDTFVTNGAPLLHIQVFPDPNTPMMGQPQFVANNNNHAAQFVQGPNRRQTWGGASQAQLMQANANAQRLQELMRQASLQNNVITPNQGQNFGHPAQMQLGVSGVGLGGNFQQGIQFQGQGMSPRQFPSMGQGSPLNQQLFNQGIPFPQGQQIIGQGQQFPGPVVSGNQGQMVPNQAPPFPGQIPQGAQNALPGTSATRQAQPAQSQPTESLRNIVQGQAQGQSQSFQPPLSQGRRKKRRADPDCARLKGDPDKYCRLYESHCHNCTLEKRLRFEVCGDGVEKARDEIKRLDLSVQGYLATYDDHVAGHPLILKVELNDKNRLHKTMSYYDAFITTKVGKSILRYKSKMILNINDIRTSGSQIGDELWETLWEHGVFKEVDQIITSPDKTHDMGQTHAIQAKAPVDTVHAKAHAHKSAGSHVTSWTSLIGGVACILIVLF